MSASAITTMIQIWNPVKGSVPRWGRAPVSGPHLQRRKDGLAAALSR